MVASDHATSRQPCGFYRMATAREIQVGDLMMTSIPWQLTLIVLIQERTESSPPLTEDSYFRV